MYTINSEYSSINYRDVLYDSAKQPSGGLMKNLATKAANYTYAASVSLALGDRPRNSRATFICPSVEEDHNHAFIGRKLATWIIDRLEVNDDVFAGTFVTVVDKPLLKGHPVCLGFLPQVVPTDFANGYLTLTVPQGSRVHVGAVSVFSSVDVQHRSVSFSVNDLERVTLTVAPELNIGNLFGFFKFTRTFPMQGRIRSDILASDMDNVLDPVHHDSEYCMIPAHFPVNRDLALLFPIHVYRLMCNVPKHTGTVALTFLNCVVLAGDVQTVVRDRPFTLFVHASHVGAVLVTNIVTRDKVSADSFAAHGTDIACSYSLDGKAELGFQPLEVPVGYYPLIMAGL
jgi:hypothetical protein